MKIRIINLNWFFNYVNNIKTNYGNKLYNKLTEFNKRDNTEAVALKNFKISLVNINGGGLEIFTKALY